MASAKLLNSNKSLTRNLQLKLIFKLFIIFESFLLIHFTYGHREHKVHNITLYPDKHSWCNVLPIKQVISHPGCKSVEIDNNVCVGACFSYSIPHTEPSDPGEVIVPYCDSCQPSEKKLIHINLECDANETEKKTQQLKIVQYITNCTCTSCEKDKYLEQILRGNSGKEIKELTNDTPDLLDAFQNHDEINPKLLELNPERSKLLKNLMNSQIMTLLKNIQSENSQKDKEELTEALKLINEQSKEKVSDATIAALVNSFYRENIELDLPKLLETLQALDNSKYFEKHRKHNHNINNHEGSGSENNYSNDNENNSNNDDETSFHEGSRIAMNHLKGSHIGMGFNHYSHHNHHHPHHHNHHHKTSHHEIDFDDFTNSDYEHRNIEHQDNNNIEVENIPNKLELTEHILRKKHKLHHMHHKHHHGANGAIHHSDISGSSSSIGVVSSTDSTNNEIDKPPPSSSSNLDEPIHIQVHPKHHHHMHHHHLGEHIGHGHLTHGPHGSLVIEPDHDQVEIQHSNGHEQINVDPTDLKPNHAGTLLSYSSHSSSSS